MVPAHTGRLAFLLTEETVKSSAKQWTDMGICTLSAQTISQEEITMANNDKNAERPDEEQVALAALVGTVLGVATWVGNKIVKGQGPWR
jgi:hypothetical protein